MYGDPLQRPLEYTHNWDKQNETIEAQALRIAEAVMVAHWLAATSVHNQIAISREPSVYTATRMALRRSLSLVLGSVDEADEFYEWMLDGYCNEPITYWVGRWAEHKRDVLRDAWDRTEMDGEVRSDDDVIVHEPTPRGVDR